MASTTTARIIILAGLLASLLGIPTQVQASADRETSISEHIFKIYLSPDLVTDMSFALMVLPKYVADMNIILQKNTNRRLVFNPETDIILTDSQPHTNYASSPLPGGEFEVWAHMTKTDQMISFGGYAGVDISGAGVLGGLQWTRLYDPDHLTPSELTDYWTQVNNMLHELAHVFGAGIGEYYKLSFIQDRSGVSPKTDINILANDDPFWNARLDFLNDPLTLNAVQAYPMRFNSRGELLTHVAYSGLTAAVLNGEHRNGIETVDLSHIILRIEDENGIPLENVNIKIWSIVGSSPYPATLMQDSYSGHDGEFIFGWGGSANPHNNTDFLRLIKIQKDGYEPLAEYLSIYDLDAAKLIEGKNTYEMIITMAEEDSLPATSTFSDVPLEHFAWQWVETLYKNGITGGCANNPLQFCPDQIVSRAQMAVFLERSLHGSEFTPPPAAASFGDTQNHWAQTWIEALVHDGITNGCGNGNFCPDMPVTRAQMALFLLRAKYGNQYSPPPASGKTFNDIPTDYWAAAWVEQLAREGITAGCGNGNYCPDNPVTRAQMAVYLGRVFP